MTRILLALLLLAGTDAVAQPSQNDALEKVATIWAISSKCPDWAINREVMIEEARKAGIAPADIRKGGKLHKTYVAKEIAARKTLADSTEFVACTMAASLFGPQGYSVQNGMVSQITTIELEDFALDWKKFVGKKVTIKECVIVGARLENAGCPLVTGRGVGGMININYGDADREVRRRAISECAATDVTKRCFADVTGRVRASVIGQVVGLDDATIRWLVD